MIQDRLGRLHTNLRISVTDRCNFRCRYCMPEEGLQWLKKAELLSFEEIESLVRIFSRLGIREIRLTGGEPLLRRDLPVLIRKISRIDGIEDLALTTNGYFLKEQALSLWQAGIKRITVSLDSLDPKKFSQITRRDFYRRVREGLEVIKEFLPIKINIVLIRGVNDNEIPQFVDLARTKAYVVRFIEFMPIGAGDSWCRESVVPSEEVRNRIAALGFKLVPLEEATGHPAVRFRFADGRGEVGFISAVTEPFCGSCNRLRMTSEGRLRTCLFALEETDLKKLLRSGATGEEISQAIRKAVWGKKPGHLINDPEFVRPERSMSQIGG